MQDRSRPVSSSASVIGWEARPVLIFATGFGFATRPRFYSLSKYALEWSTDFADQSELSDTTYNEKWDAEKFTINARLKILTRLMLNRVNRRVNAINPAAQIILQKVKHNELRRLTLNISWWWSIIRNIIDQDQSQVSPKATSISGGYWHSWGLKAEKPPPHRTGTG